jgi:cysteine desulfurase
VTGRRRIDLDANATTPLHPAVRAVMAAALGEHGNPSSLHEAGRRARDRVERARAEVAALVGGGDVVFTSGGTEADALGVVGGARAAVATGRPRRVVTSPLEHPAVKGAAAALAREGFEIAVVPCDAAGRIDPAAVADALAPGAALASFALANHELGNLYDVAAFAAAARAAGVLVHCDAVQAAGKVALDAGALGVDLLSLSAHKIQGPKGIGALWVRRGVDVAPIVGGHQERGRRAGTENLLGIIGFGEAARVSRETSPVSWARVAALRDRLEEGALAIPGSRLHGHRAVRIGNTLNLGFAGAPGDIVMSALDLEGIACATGAACSSGSVEPSPVLLALGLPRAEAAEGVRFSLGGWTTAEEIDLTLAVLPALIERIRVHA